MCGQESEYESVLVRWLKRAGGCVHGGQLLHTSTDAAVSCGGGGGGQWPAIIIADERTQEMGQMFIN